MAVPMCTDTIDDDIHEILMLACVLCTLCSVTISAEIASRAPRRWETGDEESKIMIYIMYEKTEIAHSLAARYLCVCVCVLVPPKQNVNFWHYAKNFPRENADEWK